MNNTQVAQAFADGADQGKGSNMFIESSKIFSYGYHFPIARRLPETYNGTPVALFTTRDYSVTTSKHKSYVHQALGASGYMIVEVDDVESHSISDVIDDLESQLNKALDKAAKARKFENKEYYFNQIDALRVQQEVALAVLS